MNIELYVAIKESKLKQYEVAELLGMTEARLSNIINERKMRPATESEKTNLSRVLKKRIKQLFTVSN